MKAVNRDEVISKMPDNATAEELFTAIDFLRNMAYELDFRHAGVEYAFAMQVVEMYGDNGDETPLMHLYKHIRKRIDALESEVECPQRYESLTALYRLYRVVM